MSDLSVELPTDRFKTLLQQAWECRDRAYIFGTTKVGAAALSDDNRVFLGCNVEHKFRSHDVHAEVNAITSMVASGCRVLRAIAVVAERDNFTPCGSCLDWIFQFGGKSCIVVCQSRQDSPPRTFRANELMPYYPS
jgi:cytidine deaminase